MTRRTVLVLAALVTVAVYWYLERAARAPQASLPGPATGPIRHVDPVAAPPATPIMAQQPRIDTIPAAEATPLLGGVRSYMKGFAHYGVVDHRPTVDGQKHVVLARAISQDSATVRFGIYLADTAMENVERSVEEFSPPWPDLALRIERVTPESVYVTGKSAAYGGTLTRGYPFYWKPANTGRPVSALSAPACGPTLRVDLNARTIAGIWMNQSIDSLRREVGAANVAEHMVETEGGDSTPVYTIKLCGHEIRLSWNSVSWTDPVFRTPEGLGVGSTLAAFDSVQGVGEAIGEEGNSVRYWPIKGIGYFFIDVPDGCYSFVERAGVVSGYTVDRTCRATGISFIVFSR